MALAGMSEIPLNGYKGYFGHTLGASGVLESVISVASLRTQHLMGTLGYSESGVSLPLSVVKSPGSMKLTSCLKTASGFGGCNAALGIFPERRECAHAFCLLLEGAGKVCIGAESDRFERTSGLL